MSRGMSRADRLREMERLYIERAFTDKEMADRLGVDRTAVFKDRQLLEAEVPFIEVERGRYKIDRSRYLSGIRVNLHEALALYLPARRAARQTLIAQPHVANALEKLAAALRQPMTERLVKAANAILAQSSQPERIAIMETVARGWVEQLKVSIVYRGLHARQAGHHTISPYLIEPSLWSDGAYVVGYSDYFDDVAVFKIERIEEATLTPSPFDIAEDFDEQELLRYAWGIWRGEGEPERVVLRFAPGDATRRVKESIWHPQQEKIVDTVEGGCIWAALVSEPKEMIPWIRGWGADCEVLEPKELREALKREVRGMAQLYNVMENQPMPSYLRLWAKADRETFRLHRLIYHMLDVGTAAQALWDEALPNALKTFIAETYGLGIAETGRLISFWATLHDLGKASPIFQWHPRLSEALRRVILPELRAASIYVPPWISNATTRHEIVTIWALAQQGQRGLLSETGIDPIWAYKIAAMVSGHHGEFPKDGATDADQLLPEQRGGAEWDTLRAELFHELYRIFSPPAPHFRDAVSQEQENRLLALLAAFVSVADWIGSNEEFFPYEESAVDLNGYAARSAVLARCAVATVGWAQELANLDDADFKTLFKRTPRPTQQVVIDATHGLDAPALIVLEAPTGIGKTESALYLADQWCRQEQAQGLYVAMPTMATSNQMHGRVKEFVQTRYGADVQTLLVHSQAELKHREAKNEARDPFEDSEKQQDRVTAMTWFLPRKRSLLAPFGVGTVDQTLMSILQTKHFFVRLFGLYRKVVIFDEVHAYDTYMTELFKLLLKWLRALDASVIILSATLPDKTRREMVKAYTSCSNLPSAEYPRLTIASGDGRVQVVPLPKLEPRHLALAWVERDPAAIAARLKQELGDEGCAAVICNTVDRAQEVYREIVAANSDCDSKNIILFHARTPRIWRNAKEESVLEQFGPPGKSKRPKKAIVVATQVIEQSLDLDFDVMISDLAPIDLLIQRAGRLQRHDRGKRQYPERSIFACTLEPDGMPNFEKDVYVYHLYTLLATYFALRNQHEIILPNDTSKMIERVYGEEEIKDLTDAERAVLEEKRANLENADENERRDAREKLVKPPEDDRFLYGANADLDEDDPSLHKAYRALTRNDDPGLSLICLHRTARGLALEPKDNSPVFDENAELSPEQVTEILQGVVNVRKHVVVDHFLATDLPKKWRKSHALRYHRLAVFENGACDAIPELKLVLNEKLGLRYVDRKEAQ